MILAVAFPVFVLIASNANFTFAPDPLISIAFWTVIVPVLVTFIAVISVAWILVVPVSVIRRVPVCSVTVPSNASFISETDPYNATAASLKTIDPPFLSLILFSSVTV